MNANSVASFVPAVELDRLTEGSYEKLSSGLQAAIAADATRLFGEGCGNVSLKATFKNYAVVLAEGTQTAYRVHYEHANSGEIIPISSEMLPIRAMTAKQFAMSEARAYVEAFLSGARTSADEHLRQILPHIRTAMERVQPKPAAKTVVETVESLLSSDRGWKRVYTEQLAKIRSEIDPPALKTLDEARLEPKFAVLDKFPVGERQNYKGLVTSNLKYLGGRVHALTAVVESVVKTFDSGISEEKQKTEPALKQFRSFSEDLAIDLQTVEKCITESLNTVESIDELAQIHDRVVTELHKYEVASKFVEQMFGTLTSTVSQEARVS